MVKYDFPKDFILGVATASYQIEGSREKLDNCIWDDFAKIDGKVFNHQDGLNACKSYELIDKDIEIIKSLHFKSYRFSISWTRIIKNGTGEVLQDGINYYKYLIKKLKENDIIPFVTLYHWDLPSVLQAKGGWENDEIVEWFLYYCRVVFDAFKDDVSYYVTINEPYCIVNLGYGSGIHAPGICSLKSQVKASINVLKANGAAIKLYKSMNYSGKIGICLNINDIEPINEKAITAANNIKDRGLWWYFYPTACGYLKKETIDYFKKENVFPSLSEEDYNLITTKGDFLGLNHYNPEYVDENGNTIARNDLDHNSMGWIIEPIGLYRVLKEITSKTDLDIYVLENGTATNYSKNEEINDTKRVKYYQDYLKVVERCIHESMPIKGYFAWSLLDNFEWAYGYSQRFGIVYVDFNTYERTIKQSGYFLKNVCDQIGKKTLIFDESFSGNALDLNKWNIIKRGNGFGNNEDQYYTSSSKNIKVEDNTLRIIALKEDFKNRHYTSAKITTKQDFMYGHFEIIAKVPKGNGAWPAVWMMPTSKIDPWPLCGEIDIVECIGRNPNTMHFSLHTQKYNHMYDTQRTAVIKIKNTASKYHLYEMDWTKDYISFYIDKIEFAKFYKNDVKYTKGKESWPFDQPFYLICNLAVGGNWGGKIDDTAFPMEFDIKSIKIYKWDD